MKRRLIRQELLKKLKNAGSKGLTIYALSVAGPDRLETLSTNTITKAMKSFEKNGLVERKGPYAPLEAKPYVITSLGLDVLKTAETVSNQKGKRIRIGELVEMHGAEKVSIAIISCLLRYKMPPQIEWEVVSCLTGISSLQVVSSTALRKSAIVIR